MAADKKKSVEDLIGHAMSDKSFRDRLLASPEETLKAEGYEVGQEVVDAIRQAGADGGSQFAQFDTGAVERKAAM